MTMLLKWFSTGSQLEQALGLVPTWNQDWNHFDGKVVCVHMFSMCLHGFSPGSLVSSHSPGTLMFRSIGDSKLSLVERLRETCVCVFVCTLQQTGDLFNMYSLPLPYVL